MLYEEGAVFGVWWVVGGGVGVGLGMGMGML
jgi:hypothetical protein